MIIVLDASSIIASLLSRSQTYTKEIIKLAIKNKIQLAICKETLEELKIAVASEKIKKLPNYESRIISRFIAWYQYHGLIFSVRNIQNFPGLRDEKDNIYLRLAGISRAKYIISGDKDLLSLRTTGKIKVVTPKIFWQKYSKFIIK